MTTFCISLIVFVTPVQLEKIFNFTPFLAKCCSMTACHTISTFLALPTDCLPQDCLLANSFMAQSATGAVSRITAVLHIHAIRITIAILPVWRELTCIART